MANDPRHESLIHAIAGSAAADGKGNDSSTAVRWWIKWCVAKGVNPRVEVSLLSPWRDKRRVEERLLMFNLWLVTVRGVLPDTAYGYVSTVMAWHERRYGSMLPLHAPVYLRAFQKGLERVVDAPPRPPRLGVRTQDLRASLDAVQSPESISNLSFRAGAESAFCGLLRAAEWAVKPGAKPVSTKDLMCSDLSFYTDEHGEYAVIMMRPCKKLKYVAGKTVPVTLRNGALLRPVYWLRRLVEARNVPEHLRASTPLFVGANGVSAITTDEVRTRVKRLMFSIGLDPSRYGAHSLRIGGASAAFAAGIQPAVIQMLGRWDSDCYMIYCRVSKEAAARVGSLVASTGFTDFEGSFDHEEFVPAALTMKSP